MSAAVRPTSVFASLPGNDSSILTTVKAHARACCSTSAEARTDRLIRAFSSLSFLNFSAFRSPPAWLTWFCSTRCTDVLGS